MLAAKECVLAIEEAVLQPLQVFCSLPPILGRQ